MTAQKAKQFFLKASHWLEPTDITPELIKKADEQLIGLSDVDGDALSDVFIEYTAQVKYSGGFVEKKYKMPLAIYILTSDGDISDGIRDLLLERIEITPADGRHLKLCLRYAVTARTHLNDKNMAHYLMEDPKLSERPNKLRILESLLRFDCIKNSHFTQFEEREEWTGPNLGLPCSQEYQSKQCVMDSAVSSGIPTNVEFAINSGLSPSFSGSSYGGPTMAYVSQYSWQESYQKIAYLLVEHAQAMGKLNELLAGSYRKGSRSTSCIQGLSSAGLVELVALCGAVGAGQPIYDCKIEKHQHCVNEPEGYDVSGWSSAGWKPARCYNHTISFPMFRLVGMEVAKYLRAAIFRNLRNDGGGWDSKIYDLAANFLAIAPPADDDERLIPFCIALRGAMLAEVAEDPTFLLKEANFSDAFRTKALAAITEIF